MEALQQSKNVCLQSPRLMRFFRTYMRQLPYSYYLGNAFLGFTTIELVMTMVIISALTVLAGPRFFSTAGYQQQVYYDQVLNSIRYARTLAIGTGNHIQVSLTNNSVTLQQRVEGSSCVVGTVLNSVQDPGTRASGFVKTAPGAVALSFSTNWPLYFNGLGQALTASNCTVVTTATVTIVGENTMTVFGETGFVQ